MDGVGAVRLSGCLLAKPPPPFACLVFAAGAEKKQVTKRPGTYSVVASIVSVRFLRQKRFNWRVFKELALARTSAKCGRELAPQAVLSCFTTSTRLIVDYMRRVSMLGHRRIRLVSFLVMEFIGERVPIIFS